MLTRSGPLRRTRLRPVSRKRARVQRKRRILVAELLADAVCARCGTARATDVHEPRQRSLGADILDPEQCVTLCRPCHDHVHDNITESLADGWLVASWDRPKERTFDV